MGILSCNTQKERHNVFRLLHVKTTSNCFISEEKKHNAPVALVDFMSPAEWGERGGAASRRRRLRFQTDCLTVERLEWNRGEASEGGKRKADERE